MLFFSFFSFILWPDLPFLPNLEISWNPLGHIMQFIVIINNFRIAIIPICKTICPMLFKPIHWISLSLNLWWRLHSSSIELSWNGFGIILNNSILKNSMNFSTFKGTSIFNKSKKSSIWNIFIKIRAELKETKMRATVIVFEAIEAPRPAPDNGRSNAVVKKLTFVFIGYLWKVFFWFLDFRILESFLGIIKRFLPSIGSVSLSKILSCFGWDSEIYTLSGTIVVFNELLCSIRNSNSSWKLILLSSSSN